MNRRKSTGKKLKLRYKLTIISLVLFSIILTACPPLEEDMYTNVLVYDGPINSDIWMEILNDIEKRGMPVDLDLSGCTIPFYGADVLKRAHQDGSDYSQSTGINEWDDYVQFNPLPGFPYGKEYIRSIILPKAATMIRGATDNEIKLITDDDKKGAAFRHFNNLRFVKGENIRLIGTLAFIDCTSLVEANFNRAVHILQYAFYGCISLKEAHFETAKDVMASAFENCTNLERAILPIVGTISERAFKNCVKITDVNFDIATKIGDEAFRNCISLKHARFRANPVRTTTGHPLQSFISNYTNARNYPVTTDSVIFYPNALRGCKSLEILDVRYAWNVYFSAGALADIGEHLELFLFDDGGTDNGGKCYGHPQTDMYLGGEVVIDKDTGEITTVALESEKNGNVSLTSILIRAPVVTTGESQIENYTDDKKTGILHDIRGRYGSNFEEEKDKEGNVTKYRITVQRGPAL